MSATVALDALTAKLSGSDLTSLLLEVMRGRAAQTTPADLMQRYAAVAGLSRRWIVPVPVLSPTLSSHWVGLITPVPSSIARPLVES